MPRQNPLRQALPRTRGAWQAALPHAWRRGGIGRAEAEPERAHARPVHKAGSCGGETDHGAASRSAEGAAGDEIAGSRGRACFAAPSSASPHSHPRMRFGPGTREIAISASVDGAPAAVKVSQGSPLMLVSRLTIRLVHKSLGAWYVAVSARWSCGWNRLRTKAQRLPEQLSLAT